MKNNIKVNAAENRIKDEEVAKYTIKDSIFTNLFQNKKYLLQLYKTLHPEDKNVLSEYLEEREKEVENICQLLQCQPEDLIEWKVGLKPELAYESRFKE